MNKKDALKDLLDIKKVLDSRGVEFFLGYGTCLGAYREKDFIDGDDDIDLIVTQKLTYKEKKQIGHLLKDIGFVKNDDVLWNVYGRFEENHEGYNGTEETGVIVSKRGVPITIFFFYDNGKEWMCIPKRGGIPLLVIPHKFLKKGEPIKFKKEKFLVPSPVEEYLEFAYSDWKDPNKKEHSPQYWEDKDVNELAKVYFNK